MLDTQSHLIDQTNKRKPYGLVQYNSTKFNNGRNDPTLHQTVTPNNEDITFPYWFLVDSYDNELADRLNIKIDNVDFSKNNVIVAVGAKMNLITYRNLNGKPFIKSHFVTVYFDKTFSADTAYIYLIDKIKIYQDLRDPGSISVQ